MKYLIAIVLCLIFLAGCQTAPPADEIMAPKDEVIIPQEELDHIGCQEGEIDVDGNCLPAEVSNADLFGQNLDEYVDTEDVSEGTLGFLAKPKEPGSYPGVIMIHEWWGLNDNVKEMAKLLAKERYIVLAVDLYNGEVAADSTKARELATSVRQNPQKAIEDMKNAAKYLRDVQKVEKLASLGWCFGGQQSLQISLNEQLDATVIYYGHLVDDKEQLKNIQWPVLGIFGDQDASISVDSVKSFESALNELNIENEIHIYPGVGHAFANPSGSNYAKEETIDAWAKTVKFLNENLKPEDSMMESEVAMKTFVLSGVNYKFLMDGTESPEIRVKQGDTVRIEFTSTEGFHDWVVDEFDASTERVSAGDSTFVEFVADKAGTFEYYCSVGSHRAQGMFGNLVVE